MVKVFGYLPFVAVLEIVVIYIPILYHSLYGFFITAYGQPNFGKYPYGRNRMYFLQRISGVIAFFYIGYHVWHTSLAKYWLQFHGDPHPETAIQYAHMAQQPGLALGACDLRRRHHRDRVSLHKRPMEFLHPLGHHDLGAFTADESICLLGIVR